MTEQEFDKLNTGRAASLKYEACTILKARGNFVFHGPSGRHEMAGVQDFERVAAHFAVFCSHPDNEAQLAA